MIWLFNVVGLHGHKALVITSLDVLTVYIFLINIWDVIPISGEMWESIQESFEDYS